MTDALPVGVAVPEAQALARFFHETYERLAPSFGYKTREASAVPWDDVPEQNRSLMVAVAAEVLQAFVVDGGLLSVVATLQQERDDLRADRDLAWACIDGIEMALYGEDRPQGRSRDTLEARVVAARRAAERGWAMCRTENERASVLEAELVAVRERETRLREEYDALNRWASRMPDTGFTEYDPRWDWWNQRPRAALVVSSPPPGERAALEASDKKPSDAGGEQT